MKRFLFVLSAIGCTLIYGCATSTTIQLDPKIQEYLLVYPLTDVSATLNSQLFAAE